MTNESKNNDAVIVKRLREHLKAALSAYDNPEWFVICLQGSQNYGMADELSDIDTKLLIFPKVEELVFNEKSISQTYIMPNDEHCDVKDVREYFKLFRKQNINFVEILFTDYYLVNPKYMDLWLELRRYREDIVRGNEYQALKCMKGMASEKYHALAHEYPSRMEWIDKYGYDPKQLSHLCRLKIFVEKYLSNASYKDCLTPSPQECQQLIELKHYASIGGEVISKEDAENLACQTYNDIAIMVDEACKYRNNSFDKNIDIIMNNILVELIERYLRKELKDDTD
jgi:hypothetical protein